MPYIESQTQGIDNLTAMVTEYQSCCPDSQIVLLGYSQGAQVTADFLCGRSEAGFSATPAYASQVAQGGESFFFLFFFLFPSRPRSAGWLKCCHWFLCGLEVPEEGTCLHPLSR